jgi:hypothetical protein
MKECSKCGIEKPLTEFYKDRQKKDGHGSHCKSCIKKYYAEWYAIPENREKRAKTAANYRAIPENKEKIAENNANWIAIPENKEKNANNGAKYYAEHKEKIAKYQAKWYAENKAEEPNCVYQIKNLENNKVYIGETTRGELRWKQHLNRLRGNRHPNKLLQEDFDKYGREAFEWTILKEFEDEDKSVLLLEEARSIEQFIAEDVELYNLTLTIDQLRMLTENK